MRTIAFFHGYILSGKPISIDWDSIKNKNMFVVDSIDVEYVFIISMFESN